MFLAGMARCAAPQFSAGIIPFAARRRAALDWCDWLVICTMLVHNNQGSRRQY